MLQRSGMFLQRYQDTETQNQNTTTRNKRNTKPTNVCLRNPLLFKSALREQINKIRHQRQFFVRSNVVIGHGGWSPPATDAPEAREMLQRSGMFLQLYQNTEKEKQHATPKNNRNTNKEKYVFETHYCLNRRSGKKSTRLVTNGRFLFATTWS